MTIEAAPLARSHGPARPRRIVLIICTLGIVLTALGTWATWRVDRNTEERLLEVQSRQAATVLSTAALIVQQPLRTALDVQGVTPRSAEGAAFEQVLANQVGEAEQQLFVSAVLAHRAADGFTRLAGVGADPWMSGAEAQEFLQRAFDSPVVIVGRVFEGDRSRIAYALADPGTGYVVYTESEVPENRRSSVESDAAFSNLDYAIYLGEKTDLDALTTTSVDPESLPLDGLTHTTTTPFGDTVITLVVAPREHLGSTLSRWLPLIVLLGGLVLTAGAALVARQLVRARGEAEENTAIITGLYERVDDLYEEQRAVSVRLQRALLPQAIPDVPHLQVATEYVAGAHGVDIGGDWYSMLAIGDDRFGFVVGDVSGHGVDAVAVMARASFTLRAYLMDGNTPQLALEKCSRQFDIGADEHMITAVVGVGDARTGELTLATAGHPPPLLIGAGSAEYVDLPVGPPLGIGATSYSSATTSMPAGSTLLLFTDGLVERRSEPIDVGMRRLTDLAAPLAEEPLDDLVDQVVSTLRHEDAPDDIAVLALRREDA